MNVCKTLLAACLLSMPIYPVLAQGKPLTGSKPVNVDTLAKSPKSYLGKVVVVGTVAIITAKKGFLLIDSSEYKKCGLTCLSEAGTKKIPVKWTGSSPKAETEVKVSGILKKSAQGFEFVASKVDKP